MYDLKQWFLMPLSNSGCKYNAGGIMTPYGRDTHHLEGLNLTNNTKVYAYHNDTGKTMIFSKAPQKDANGKLTLGWPWDLKSYDETAIYDWATELDWTSSRDYKMQTSPLAMCPRYWDGDPTVYRFSQHAAYNVVENCKPTGHGDVGPVYYTLQGPFISLDFGGDVGQTACILLTYYWGDKKNREQLFLTQTAGWVKWTHGVLTQLSPGTADYVIDAEVVHNRIVPGVVTPLFPCQVIP
jgi:hypothetical protein